MDYKKNRKKAKKDNLTNFEKRRILIYICIFILSIFFIIFIIFSLAKKYNKNKEEKIRFAKTRREIKNKYGENYYINKRDIKQEELYHTDYNLNAEMQLKYPEVGDFIFEIKFKNYNPLKFKIFYPNAPRLSMDLENAVKEGKLIGKKIDLEKNESQISINRKSKEKIWTTHSKNNLDLKLVPFYGSLVVNTNKIGDENYGSELDIITYKNDETEILKKAKYPKDLIELSRKHKGSIIANYSKKSVIGQMIDDDGTLEKINREVQEESQNEGIKTDIEIEEVKFYQYTK